MTACGSSSVERADRHPPADPNVGYLWLRFSDRLQNTMQNPPCFESMACFQAGACSSCFVFCSDGCRLTKIALMAMAWSMCPKSRDMNSRGRGAKPRSRAFTIYSWTCWSGHLHLVGGLEPWNFIFPYIGYNDPNWLILFRGVGQPPSSTSFGKHQSLRLQSRIPKLVGFQKKSYLNPGVWRERK